MQEKRNSSALVMELRLSCINPSVLFGYEYISFYDTGLYNVLYKLYSSHVFFYLVDFISSNIGHVWKSDTNVIACTGLSSAPDLNPLRAKFFGGNINIYSHFVSFLHIGTTQVAEILPQVRQEPIYST